MNYYCNQKFTNMQINLERQEINSCCSALPKKIDVKWLKINQQNLFNSPDIIEDRKNMLENKPASSCNVCYETESRSSISRRKFKNGEEKNITDLFCKPKEISLILDTACNLTCSYCGKEYSSAWLRDISTNGEYFNDDTRFTINSYDKIIVKAGHKKIHNSSNYKLLLESVLHYKDIDYVNIIGGEPFLNNNLINLVNTLENKVVIYSGLGINNHRFKNILNKLKKENVSLTISAENINEFYEFNRYGNTFYNFLKNLESIHKFNIKFNFNSVISNTTIFGFKDFLNYFANDEIIPINCMEPIYLSPNVIDLSSKQIILSTDYKQFSNYIHSLVNAKSNFYEKKLTNSFLKEFTKRRNLNLNIFPTHFLEWLDSS